MVSIRKAAIVVFCAAMATAVGVVSAGAAPPGSSRASLIISPRAGTTDGPVQVSLRIGHSDQPHAVRVMLNGRDISSYFRTVVRGRRTAEASPSQGLRYGQNTLSVTLNPGVGAVRR